MKIGEYHLGDILGYPPVLTGEYLVTWRVETKHAQAQLMDHKQYELTVSCGMESSDKKGYNMVTNL